MDRAEAEAIYDSGRKACVKVLLALANQVERLEGRVERLEEEIRELRRDSDNSSLPPSADPGRGKRAGKRKRSDRNPGGQPGHRGSGRGLLPESRAKPRTGPALCEEGRRKSVKTRYHRGLARNLTKVWPALWSFLEHEGVEPTNNRAERGLRHAVIYRKLSQGSRCERGALVTERLLSAAISCRLQGRSLFAYLVEVAQASIRGQPTPALV
jgi:Family of unknown function (DUF6444)/Transposase IS66 family